MNNNKQVNFKFGKYKLPIGTQTYIMGILNITPDSFSDGGKYNDLEAAVNQARDMVRNGAHIIDVGGESTRPGHVEISPEEEIDRVVPVIDRITREIDIPVSVDTSKAKVAEKALMAGATIVNDVWGLQRDINLAGVVAGFNAGVVMMHNKSDKNYNDLLGEIIAFLNKSISIAKAAGINPEACAIDPGFGFGKTLEQNLEVMRRLKELSILDLPVLIGTSRKSMIGNVLKLEVDERLEGTAATVAIGIANGADIIRVHDVREMARVAKMSDAIVRGI